MSKFKYLPAALFSLVMTSAYAAGPDLTSLTNSVDFGTVLTAIMAVAATLVTLYAGYAGVRWVLRIVKGA